MFNILTCMYMYDFSAGSDDESLVEIPLMLNSDEGFEMDENDSLMKPRRYRPYGQSRISFWCSRFWDNCCDR